MTIDLDLEELIEPDVYEAHEVFLPRSELELGTLTSRSIRLDIASVYQVVRALGRASAVGGPVFLERSLVVPLVQEHGAEINVVVGRCRTVYYDGANHAGAILNAEMRVVPGATITCGLESICLLTSRWDGAFSDTAWTVGIIVVELTEAMP